MAENTEHTEHTEQTTKAATRRGPVARRPHPSHGARVVALVGSVVATVGTGVGMAYADHASTATSGTTAAAASTATAGASRSNASTSTATATSTRYADGTYTGAAEYTRWGDVQVQVTVSGGKVVSVQEIQAPSDGRSASINSRAQPILESEAVARQSAKLDIVSGATYTSRAYAASLQAALDQAAQPAAATA